MHKKIASLMIAVTIVGTLTVPVFANPAVDKQKEIIKMQKEQINKNKAEIDKNKVEYDKAMTEVHNIEIEIEKLDNKIENMMARKNDADKKINKTNEKITLSQMELDKALADMKTEQDLFKRRAKNLYMSGSDSYLEVILDSKGLHDFISRIENLRTVAELDKKIMGELKNKQAKIEKRKSDLEGEKKSLVSLKVSIEKDINGIKEAKKKQDPLIAQAREKRDKYKNVIDTYNARIKQSQDKINSANNKIDEINRPVVAPQPRPSRGGKTSNFGGGSVPSAGPVAQRAVQYALSFQGVPYVWGGRSPSGFDCSGLMQYVYGRLGVGLGSTTYTQIGNGVAVSRDQLQPGDLVFFGSASAPHHVGMYIGGGQYVHAPRTGDVVKISPLTRRDYCGARRVAF
ncbi:NlpC/P60 family protein [Hathewaya histolytica]|uniref:Cell wall-associated hydrolase, invasion-associated protein n=1 Tax=Hathewaya histolytica TaxID=1498 RepID=A0A4U9QW38_HATHI|nr:C40 family peptidase [Hathewaya histolytica]VTQ82619.1 cell wall-associated hydrolase, invasion-associated protein [Hathewaya histolytica]